jgi:hypothetical protein
MTFVARSISRMHICGRGVSFILIEAAHSPVFRSETLINSTFTFDSTFTNPGTRAQPKFAVNSRRPPPPGGTAKTAARLAARTRALAGIGGHWFSPLGNPRLRSFHPTDQR